MRSLLILGFSIIILAANQLSALAQTRQPTNAEIKRLRQEFRQIINLKQKDKSYANYIRDRRTSQEKQARASFIDAWSKTEPGLAPFFGVWGGYETARHIYPSNIKGRVCVIKTGEGYGSFDVGVLSNGVIKTNSGEVLFKEGNYLAPVSIKNGRFVVNLVNDIPLNSPTSLEPLTQLLNYIFELPDKSNIAQQFNAADCTNLKPGQQSNTWGNSTNSSKRIIAQVVFDVYEYESLSNKTRLGLPEKDELGHFIMGKKDIQQLSANKWFSIITFQDGFIRPAILQRAKKIIINYFAKDYQVIKLIKVAEGRYILNSEHDPVEGGDDYYDIDLTNINSPIFKQIDLATAQRLGKNKGN
ncbi:hypothetical protein GTQ43_03550 [Nostoc sp. KVJ3]|uniref:hypothetical protein n=1 Tax=Nostoc sp. KVJ3 TaxID=457945 RepID=UPI0022390183|nr:hypothetical protein [Nostoc sp. KVJ3]MCW5312956.1 hypothetical protein [Nostoc sp. KVJ3]